MIHVFHGFLGSPRDFEFLSSPGVMVHNLHQLEIKNFKLSSQDVLIGYSMGGRIAMELAHQSNYRMNRLILINAHPGLTNEQESADRKKWEDSIESKMDSPDFIKTWNSFTLFAHDLPLMEKERSELLKDKMLFNRYRLSGQRNYLPELVKHKDKVLWIIGKQDDKYRALAQSLIAPNGIPYKLANGGHRLFQRPEELMKVFKDEGVL